MERLRDSVRGLCRPETPVEQAALIYFDTETTGLHPERGAEVCEAAIIDRGGLRLEWKAERNRPFGELLPELLDHLAGAVVVGHNLSFDVSFLAYEAARRGLSGPDVRYVDTLGLVGRLRPEIDDRRLESLVDRWALAIDGPMHTAAVDARATRAVFWHLVDEAGLARLEDAGLQRLQWSSP